MSGSQESIRLQKFLSERGVCSRRMAEQWIVEGCVTINGRLAVLGDKVNPATDKVVVNGRTVRNEPPRAITLAMHKPRGWICTHRDPHHSDTIYNHVPSPFHLERLLCAGRLDKDSEGLLILTNDGDLMQKLTHPSHRIVKRYRVTLTRPFNPVHIGPMLRGFEDEGETIRAEKIFLAEKGPLRERQLEIHLQHGRKREIRRLVEHFGYYVERLIRYQIGALTLRGIGVGSSKLLTPNEVEMLFL